MNGETSVGPDSWRARGFGLLRIGFGLVWAVDAWFKWQPRFVDGFMGYVMDAAQGQPAAVRSWIHFWHDVIGVDPRAFAYLVAVAETLVAAGLILGAFSNLVNLTGAALLFVIWSAAEGFGGPYTAGSTDIGAAVIYVFVFAALWIAGAGMNLGLDSKITPALGRWGFLASGPLRDGESDPSDFTLRAHDVHSPHSSRA